MGAPRFQTTLATVGIAIDDELAATVVRTYRERFWRVKGLWADMQEAAMAAVSSQRPEPCGRVTWLREGVFLYCILPSGRTLAYPYPQIKATVTSWGETRPALTFMGVDALTRQWKRQTTYGGSLTENACQATARDILAEALLRLEASDAYSVVLGVHDEAICEAVEGTGSLQEFTAFMEHLPDWAYGCPVAAESWQGGRYKK